MLALDVVLAALLVTACNVAWRVYKEWKRSDSMLAQARAEIGKLERTVEDVKELEDRVRREARDEALQRGELQKQLATFHKVLSEKDEAIKRLQCLDLEHAERLNSVKSTLDKRDAELANLRRILEEKRIRSEAKIEGLEKLLRQEQDTTKGLRHRLTEAEKQANASQHEHIRELQEEMNSLHVQLGLSSHLVHPSRTGDGRSAPAATVANRDTSKNGPTSEQLQALADLLLAGLQRKYPLLATWGPQTAKGV